MLICQKSHSVWYLRETYNDDWPKINMRNGSGSLNWCIHNHSVHTKLWRNLYLSNNSSYLISIDSHIELWISWIILLHCFSFFFFLVFVCVLLFFLFLLLPLFFFILRDYFFFLTVWLFVFTILWLWCTLICICVVRHLFKLFLLADLLKIILDTRHINPI